MNEKTFKIVDGDISDGYHTFDELYDHRCLLFLLLTKTLKNSWLIVDHLPEWDLVALETEYGQISYHIPSRFRNYISKYITNSPESYVYDGHTSSDVLERLRLLITR